MKFKIYALLFLSVLMLTNCQSYNQDDYQEYVVVEGYITAGERLPDIYVSTTLPSDSTYSFEESAISNAIVQITRLDDSGEPEELFEYVENLDRPGTYSPIIQSYRAEPLESYRLDIVFNDRPEEIRAVTTVPDQVEVINEIPESVVYQSDDQLEIVLNQLRQTADGQNVFVFNTISLDPSIENLTPFYLSVVEDDDEDDIDITDYVRNSSGLINEGNFESQPDGTILLRFPWIGVAFYEENLVVTLSVDKNLADVIRSQEVQLGGSTLSPGEIPNLLYNIEGGIGVFGSMTADSVTTTFVRPF